MVLVAPVVRVGWPLLVVVMVARAARVGCCSVTPAQAVRVGRQLQRWVLVATAAPADQHQYSAPVVPVAPVARRVLLRVVRAVMVVVVAPVACCWVVVVMVVLVVLLRRWVGLLVRVEPGVTPR